VNRTSAFHKKLQELDCTESHGFFLHDLESSQTEYHLFLPSSARICTVLFHGTGNDALFGWENLILDLLQSGRAVLSFDLPGHGQNSSTLLSFESVLQGGDELFRSLVPHLPDVTSWEAIGYSLGALIALDLALNEKMQWSRLVLIALPEEVSISPHFVLAESLSLCSAVFWQQLQSFGWSSALPAFGRFRRQRFPIRLQPSLSLSYPAFIAELFRQNTIEPRLHLLQVPTLFVYGSRDYLAKTAYGRSLHQRLGRSEFIEVPGANHFLLPLMPETRAAILQWLSTPTSPCFPAGNSAPR